MKCRVSGGLLLRSRRSFQSYSPAVQTQKGSVCWSPCSLLERGKSLLYRTFMDRQRLGGPRHWIHARTSP